MNIKSLLTLVVSLMLMSVATSSCGDETGTLGLDMMPANDLITSRIDTFQVSTRSYAVGDSVLARSSKSYLGRFTDPETNTTVKSDFLAQFNCLENFTLPDSIQGDSAFSTMLYLQVPSYVGDSLTSFKVSVYELDSILDPNEHYYTNIDPGKFYDQNKEPIATKWFTLADQTNPEVDKTSSDYINNIYVSLPKEIGTTWIKEYKKNKDLFKNKTAWVNSGLPCSKGLYFKLEKGDGAMAYIDVCNMCAYFNYYDTEYKRDTTGYCLFSATEEVVEATRFENSNLDKLLENKSATYLKSPAGIFTEVTMPVDEIFKGGENMTDTINSAKISFTRYNDKVQSDFKLGIPQSLLMVRLDDYNNGFFENYKVNNNTTSYLATFNSKTNSYVFSNISLLLSAMLKDKETNPDTYNKVLLIPVEYTTDSSKNPVLINHDFSMSSTKLVGGENETIPMEIIFSSFKK